jgi:hypothetical protein
MFTVIFRAVVEKAKTAIYRKFRGIWYLDELAKSVKEQV